MNTVILMGRLTRDPQINLYGEENKKMARFTVAVDRRFKTEGQPSADFIGCVAYGKLADFIDNYLRQGTKILLTGRIQSGSYTNKDGQKVYTTDVLANEIEFAESKKSADRENTAPSPAKAEAPASDGFENVTDEIEEDLPFT